MQRLGRSNTRRRQLLGCRKRHHEKAASQFDLEPSASVPSHYSESKGNSFQQGKGDKSAGTRLENEHCGDHQGLSKKEQGTDALSESTVTPYEQPKEVTVDQLSDTGFSQTSYSSSISGAHEMLCVPPLPNRDCAEAFQCPYCFMVITAPSQKVWKYARINHSQCLYLESDDSPGNISSATSDPMFALLKTASNLIISLTTATIGSRTKLRCTAENILATFAIRHRPPVPTSRGTFRENIRNGLTLVN